MFRRIAAWLYDSLVVAAVLMLAGGLAMGIMAILLSTGLVDITGYEDVSDYMTRHPVVGVIYPAYLATAVISFYTYFW
ncbi:RDD family protein, partial [Vibrio natriegens]